MRLFVAYALTAGAHDLPGGIEGALGRLRREYVPRCSSPPTEHRSASTTCGVVMLHGGDRARWPAWVCAGPLSVAHPYAPLGLSPLIGAPPPGQAPLALARHLQAHPAAALTITPPFVGVTHDADRDRLELFTDALGVGRLFAARAPTGWVWSNRPVAALLLAGLPVQADLRGWRSSAVADEFAGDVTPVAGVTAVDAATHLVWDGPQRRLTATVTDTTTSWVPSDPGTGPAPDLLDEAAADLTAAAASVLQTYEGTPVVDLSGGRDSRLVAAAFVAAGADVTLHSHDAVPGDLVTARDLVSLLPASWRHDVVHTSVGGTAPARPLTALPAARRWHDYAEGLRPCTYLPSTAPSHIDEYGHVAVGGAGGEAAHGYYYPSGLPALLTLPVDERLRVFATRIVARQSSVPAAGARAREEMFAYVLDVLRRADAAGWAGAAVLDVYYVRQRMRRWGSTGERPGVVSPLLAGSFIRAALALTPEQRGSAVLHRELTRRLVPRWADVPYFPAETGTSGAGAAPPPRIVRLGEATDRDEVAALLADTACWGAAFDTAAVHRLWHRSVAGQTSAGEELPLRRAVWRGAFEDYLGRVDGRSAVTRPAADVPLVAPPAPPSPPAVPVAPPAVRSPRDVRARLRALARPLAATRAWGGGGRGRRAAGGRGGGGGGAPRGGGAPPRRVTGRVLYRR